MDEGSSFLFAKGLTAAPLLGVELRLRSKGPLFPMHCRSSGSEFKCASEPWDVSVFNFPEVC